MPLPKPTIVSFRALLSLFTLWILWNLKKRTNLVKNVRWPLQRGLAKHWTEHWTLISFRRKFMRRHLKTLSKCYRETIFSNSGNLYFMRRLWSHLTSQENEIFCDSTQHNLFNRKVNHHFQSKMEIRTGMWNRYCILQRKVHPPGSFDRFSTQ